MNFRTFRTRQALAIIGACFGLLLLASPASAVPDGFVPRLESAESSDAFSRFLANHRAREEQVNAATWGDQSDAFTRALANGQAGERAYHATRTGIPDSVAASLERNAAAEPSVTSAPHPRNHPETAPVTGRSFDWETTGLVGGGILAALLLALMSTIALRDRRGLRSA